VDWWPLSLYVNNDVKPYGDKDVRWAISHYIDRQQLIEVAYLGASTVSSLPMPPVQAAAAVFRRGEGLACEIQYAGINPKKGDALLEGRGFKKKATCGRERTASR